MAREFTNAYLYEGGGTSNSDFYLEPTSLWYAENYLSQAIESILELQPKIQSVCNASSILGTYGDSASSCATSFNLVLEKLTSIASNFSDYKSKMIAADSSLELLFLYMDMTGGEINLEDTTEFIYKSEDEMTLLILEYYLENYENNKKQILKNFFGSRAHISRI